MSQLVSSIILWVQAFSHLNFLFSNHYPKSKYENKYFYLLLGIFDTSCHGILARQSYLHRILFIQHIIKPVFPIIRNSWFINMIDATSYISSASSIVIVYKDSGLILGLWLYVILLSRDLMW